MNESKYAVGLDIGTDMVKVVVGHTAGRGSAAGEGSVTAANPNQVTVIGVGTHENGGMRKGTVVNLDKTAEAVDRALEAAERMSGYQIDRAAVSINGSHIVGFSSRGVIAVGAGSQTIGHEELTRVEEAATVVQLPANREILDVTPRSYKLDAQDNIRDPFGMTGVRLEVDAYMITALAPHLKNVEKVLDMTELPPSRIVVSGLAAARVGLNEQQRENGVVLIDIGGTTTNVDVYEEGDIVHAAVLPVGSNNITNDLAIGLKTDLNIAEKVKIEHAVAAPELRRGSSATVSVKVGGRELSFDSAIVDEVVEARLAEIFELVNKELKKVKKQANLPGGAVLTGGGAKLRGIADYAREVLGMNAMVAKIDGFDGMKEQVSDPSFAAALGLMMIDLDLAGSGGSHKKKRGSLFANAGAGFSKLFAGPKKK
ncbi:cell division protein FtsA [Candidatus Saccharibacteria bacterium]|nr:cell division protein FtsA [Candidatus Saccharibacteria bacterium]